MTEKRFTIGMLKNFVNDNKTNYCYMLELPSEAKHLCNLLNQLNDENEQLKDEVYNELDNALTVLTELYEVIPISSQSKMNRLYNRLKSLRDDIK